ncbi:protein CURVATURE THYLAKOID 1D, chloroplastic [Apium graveolens]|uniref:protein CURVATURE THYLAKOID 1D, chloroplastic n=1 Tax=Apium graveolens TaxID=4045 RepID=UPI003D7C0252
MVVCTSISSIPHLGLGFLTPNHNNNNLCFQTHLPLNRIRPSFKRTYSGWHYVINSSLKSTTSEEASSGASQYNKEEADGVVMIEDVQRDEKVSYGAEAVQTVEKNDSNGAEGPSEESLEDEQFQPFEFLNKLNMELDSDSPYPLLVYGGSSLITLWLASAVVGSIDSIPVFPKLMEVVGLGYSVWFATRYLLFKKNRDELTAKIEEIKQEVLGSSDD